MVDLSSVAGFGWGKVGQLCSRTVGGILQLSSTPSQRRSIHQNRVCSSKLWSAESKIAQRHRAASESLQTHAVHSCFRKEAGKGPRTWHNKFLVYERLDIPVVDTIVASGESCVYNIITYDTASFQKTSKILPKETCFSSYTKRTVSE